jgi:hypothetical protein
LEVVYQGTRSALETFTALGDKAIGRKIVINRRNGRWKRRRGTDSRLQGHVGCFGATVKSREQSTSEGARKEEGSAGIQIGRAKDVIYMGDVSYMSPSVTVVFLPLDLGFARGGK